MLIVILYYVARLMFLSIADQDASANGVSEWLLF